MPTAAELCHDLAAEHAVLDALVAALPAAAWATATPAAGWDVRDSISHLCYFDEAATLALTDPDGFASHQAELSASMVEAARVGPGASTPDVALGRALPDPAALLARWRASRTACLVAAERAAGDQDRRVPWYGPPMSVASFVTARLMETWAHGTDVGDALGTAPESGPRLRHVIHIGVAARPFAFAIHGATDPGDPIRVEAIAPDGTTWAWGPPDAPDRVTGNALDLALALTQRRHPSRTGLVIQGPVAEQWMAVAQAFAGAPTVTDAAR